VTVKTWGAFALAAGSTSAYVSSTAHQILNGALTVAVQDDTGNGLDASELDRINEAMSYLNDALGSFGVDLAWAAAGTDADVHIHFASSTPWGGKSEGVLGFTTAENDVYLVWGWNFYTGADPTQIGTDQYDFLTLATHELAHTVGLGESSDPDSVMYEYLAPGTVRRTFTAGNLTAINTDSDRFMKVDPDAAGAAGVLHGAGREADELPPPLPVLLPFLIVPGGNGANPLPGSLGSPVLADAGDCLLANPWPGGLRPLPSASVPPRRGWRRTV